MCLRWLDGTTARRTAACSTTAAAPGSWPSPRSLSAPRAAAGRGHRPAGPHRHRRQRRAQRLRLATDSLGTACRIAARARRDLRYPGGQYPLGSAGQRLAPELRRFAGPATRVALSGILADQAAEVIAAFRPWVPLIDGRRTGRLGVAGRSRGALKRCTPTAPNAAPCSASAPTTCGWPRATCAAATARPLSMRSHRSLTNRRPPSPCSSSSCDDRSRSRTGLRQRIGTGQTSGRFPGGTRPAPTAPELQAAATYVPLPVSDDTLEFDIPEDNWSNFFEGEAQPGSATGGRRSHRASRSRSRRARARARG